MLFRVGGEYLVTVVVGGYDIAADDQRFLMRRRVAEAENEAGEPPRLILVQNWFEELRQKLGN